ncbi:DUF4918 domain-containing protein [Niastella koreensis]|uniref:Uracil-DNA glycosylase-like domain-containing protein n=2 Tax=Niastella koreensis TaxID=354356 RepID=G8TR05_NIAKG|nr:uracil-DNA glycosylase family protein [Niastella koreensis]AEV97904.1 hypothetical protein Niako_1535 [Niastella koreensis GR20-10]OQP40290.1 DUF4918 domain-containing protein [Niastella koreensis]
MKTAAQKLTQSYAILNFLKNLKPQLKLGAGIEIMNPFSDAVAVQLAETFYHKYYNDQHPRKYIFGINPGRFGAGVTGVPFTDPIRLKDVCGIDSDLPKKAELSSLFVYAVIDAYGGPEAFYRDFYITALSPLGFTKNGVNLNYYDDKELLKDSEPFILQCIREQLASIATTQDVCYCLGEGTNYRIFQKLNVKHQFFKEIVPLPHPRWVMQYRRKKMDEFVKVYVEKLKRM